MWRPHHANYCHHHRKDPHWNSQLKLPEDAPGKPVVCPALLTFVDMNSRDCYTSKNRLGDYGCSFVNPSVCRRSYWSTNISLFFRIIIRPSSDGTYYGMVMSVRVSVRPTLRPVSVRPSGCPPTRFPHFSPTCFDILSWNFAHDFVLMYYRSSLSVITLRQFLKELCLFVNLEYKRCTVFRSFLPLALTYWAEILHMTLFWCTTEQVWVSSLCVNFWRSYASLWT